MSRFKQSEDVLKIISFSQRHKWARYFCLGAVSAHYLSDVVSSKLSEADNSVKKAASKAVGAAAPVIKRGFAVVVSAAFGVMALPFAAFAEELSDIPENTESILLNAANVAKAVSEEFEIAEDAESDRGAESEIVKTAAEIAADAAERMGAVGYSDISAENTEVKNSDIILEERDAAEETTDTEKSEDTGSENEYTTSGKPEKQQTSGNALAGKFALFDNLTGISDIVDAINEGKLEYTYMSDSDFEFEDSDDETLQTDGKGVVSAEISESTSYPEPEDGSEIMGSIMNIFISGSVGSDIFYIDVLDGTEKSQIGIMESSTESRRAIASAFETYGINSNDMNIHALDIDIYNGGEETERLEKTVVSVVVPNDMLGHLDDLRAVRLDGERIEILESEYSYDEEGNTLIIFESPYLSSFALVSYADKPENMSSGAGTADIGAVVNGSAEPVFSARIKKGGKEAAKKKKFRIAKKLKKDNLIF